MIQDVLIASISLLLLVVIYNHIAYETGRCQREVSTARQRAFLLQHLEDGAWQEGTERHQSQPGKLCIIVSPDAREIFEHFNFSEFVDL